MFEWEDMLMIQISVYIECYGCANKETNHLQMIKNINDMKNIFFKDLNWENNTNIFIILTLT
jgi:hypothetical protein